MKALIVGGRGKEKIVIPFGIMAVFNASKRKTHIAGVEGVKKEQ